MRADKQKRLKATGWKVGSASEFLSLSPGEEAYIEIRLRLADGLKKCRARRGMTQGELATAIHSSQSRVCKMVAGDSSVSIDLLVRTLLALDVSKRELAGFIAGHQSRAA